MAIPVGAFANAFKLGIDTTMESDTPVRVAVYVDESASPAARASSCAPCATRSSPRLPRHWSG